jgi:hypothetical protein
MAKPQRVRESPEPAAGQPAAGKHWPVWATRLASVAIALHLLAVITGPWAAPIRFRERSSDLALGVWHCFRPYVELGFLNHGYRFFAPDPGRVQHLMSYKVYFDDGRPPLNGTLPDLGYWPRLRYHRHFMLTDQLPGLDPRTVDIWNQSFSQHLKQKYGAQAVELYECWHVVPSMEEVRAGRRIGDPQQYVNDIAELGNPERRRQHGSDAWVLIGRLD